MSVRRQRRRIFRRRKVVETASCVYWARPSQIIWGYVGGSFMLNGSIDTLSAIINSDIKVERLILTIWC